MQYVVADPATRRCAVVDPVLDFDEKSGAVATRSADALLRHVQGRDLHVDWILDIHPHADHLSAAGCLKDRTGGQTATGEHVADVQRLWKDIYNLPSSFPTDGSQWDRLFADGERFRIGGLDASVMFSLGHTLASTTYVVGDAAFVHDTLFMPDGGTAQADFPGGDARQLWRSIQRILASPDDTRLFTGHDYQPGGRAPAWESTPAGQRAGNAHLHVDEAGFVELRTRRDRALAMPRLILEALQHRGRPPARPRGQRATMPSAPPRSFGASSMELTVTVESNCVRLILQRFLTDGHVGLVTLQGFRIRRRACG